MDTGQFVASFLPFLEEIPVIRAFLGIILVFFLPGFAWTLVFFRRINILERVALSIGISIASLTLALIALNLLLGVKISGTSAVITILVLTAAALAIYLVKRFLFPSPEVADGD